MGSVQTQPFPWVTVGAADSVPSIDVQIHMCSDQRRDEWPHRVHIVCKSQGEVNVTICKSHLSSSHVGVLAGRLLHSDGARNIAAQAKLHAEALYTITAQQRAGFTERQDVRRVDGGTLNDGRSLAGES